MLRFFSKIIKSIFKLYWCKLVYNYQNNYLFYIFSAYFFAASQNHDYTCYCYYLIEP